MRSKVQKAAEITVAYNYKPEPNERPMVKCAADSLIFIIEGYDMKTIGIQEQFVVMYLNASNSILGIYRVSTGGLTATIADIRLILGVALKIGATSLILSHNHPSGNLKPSHADNELTQKIRTAASYMDIKLLDHLIIHPSGTTCFSYAEEGLT